MTVAYERADQDSMTPIARQQPDWNDPEGLERVRQRLASAAPLVTLGDVLDLRERLAAAAAGKVQIIQAGDCAEDWAECTPVDVVRKQALLDAMAGVMSLNAHRPVLRAGRLAGQYGKPRSNDTETVNGVELPVYRGHMVNSPEPDPVLRRPDPRRMLTGYQASQTIMELLGWGGAAMPRLGSPVWTSHEMLLLDYERPLVRRQADGRWLLTSTHWPWIGERTRQVDGAHVALLASVANPVACKAGPRMTTDELLALCERLDPEREPGRLTLIARMGADAVAGKLPRLVAAVRAAGHPVVWLSDPVHGNTVERPGGVKTRLVPTVVREVREFQDAVASAGGVAGGLHLETTPYDVGECVDDEQQAQQLSEKYTTFCDPRLNPRQALTVAAAWRG